MKIFVYCGVVLILAVIASMAVGYQPTQHRWGADGIESMFAVAGICLPVALVPVIVMGMAAKWWPSQLGLVAFAGTTIRLLGTMMCLVTYQFLIRPHLTSFLFWATILYLLLLVIETTFAVIVVHRFDFKPPTKKEGIAS